MYFGIPGNQLFERIKLVFTEEALYPTLAYTKAEVPSREFIQDFAIVNIVDRKELFIIVLQVVL